MTNKNEPLHILNMATLLMNQVAYYDWLGSDMLILLRPLLISLFFAYLLRPKAAEVHIHMKEANDFVLDNEDDETLIDELDNSIVEQLKAREPGTSARMLTLALRSSYPELELADMDDRLHILQSKGLVSCFKGQLRAPLWIAS